MMIDLRKVNDEIDEVVATNCAIHLERLDKDHWWISIIDNAEVNLHLEFFGVETVMATNPPST